MVVSINRLGPAYTLDYDNPCYRCPQKGTPNFRKPPHIRLVGLWILDLGNIHSFEDQPFPNLKHVQVNAYLMFQHDLSMVGENIGSGHRWQTSDPPSMDIALSSP